MKELDAQIVMLVMARGEIVISALEVDQRKYTFITPAVVVHERGAQGLLGFMLAPWMPNELLRDANVEMDCQCAVGSLKPTPELVSFYKAWAETERDKLKIHAKDFMAQLAAIEKYHVDRHTKHKERHSREIFVNSETLPDTLLSLFEEDTDWGNPSITN